MEISKVESVWNLMSEYSFIIDSDSLSDSLECVICKKLMIDACHSTCGCQYCYKCIASYLKESDKYCPGGNVECNEEYLVLERDVTRNRKLNNKILKLRVQCPNEFCDSMLELTQMEEHLRVCYKEMTKCPYVDIGCGNMEGPKDEVISHLNRETLLHSQLLIELIDNLRNEVNVLKENLELSKSELLSFKEESRNEINILKENLELSKSESLCFKEESRNKLNILRDNLKKNKLEMLSLNEVTKNEINILKEDLELSKSESLSFKEESRKEINVLKENLKKNSLELLSLKEVKRNEINNLKHDLEKNKVDLISLKEESGRKDKRIIILEQEVKQVRNDITSRLNWVIKEVNKNKVTIEEKGKKIEVMNNDLSIIKGNINIIKKDNDKVINIVKDIKNDVNEDKGQNCKSIENKLGLVKYEVKEMKENRCTNIRTDFMWKIYELSVKVETKALSDIFSQAFYCKDYKLCLCLWINGDNIGLYCIIMKGDNDDKLSWPMTHSIKLNVHNQLTFGIYKSVTIQYDKLNEEALERPKDEMNYRVGAPWPFLNYSIIKEDSAVIINDSIIVSCGLE